MRLVLQHARRERPKALPELDLQVHRRLHFRRARIADDAAGSERARAKLHPALEPADDLAGDKQVGDEIHQITLVSHTAVDRARSIEDAADFAGRESRPEEAPLLAIHSGRRPRFVEELMPDEEARRPARRRHRRPPAESRCRRTGPSRRSRPLATQLSATPPASTRFSCRSGDGARGPCAA